jgi:hypothetical protein
MGIMEVAIMTGLWIRTVIILSYMAFSPFDPQICPKSNGHYSPEKKIFLKCLGIAPQQRAICPLSALEQTVYESFQPESQ